MQIYDCDQGSGEWLRLRCGIPTASEFASILANGKGGAPSATRRTYMLKLAGERLTGESMENFINAHIERGKIMEEEARDLYGFIADTEPRRIGFIANGPKGCSPDALVGDKGMVEIKTALPHILIDTVLKDEFPPAHKAQCQGALWIAEREWIDIAVYWPRLPLFVKRAYRDEAYIRQLSSAVDAFNAELAEVVERVRALQGAPIVPQDKPAEEPESDPLDIPPFLDRRQKANGHPIIVAGDDGGG